MALDGLIGHTHLPPPYWPIWNCQDESKQYISQNPCSDYLKKALCTTKHHGLAVCRSVKDLGVFLHCCSDLHQLSNTVGLILYMIHPCESMWQSVADILKIVTVKRCEKKTGGIGSDILSSGCICTLSQQRTSCRYSILRESIPLQHQDGVLQTWNRDERPNMVQASGQLQPKPCCVAEEKVLVVFFGLGIQNQLVCRLWFQKLALYFTRTNCIFFLKLFCTFSKSCHHWVTQWFKGWL